MTATTNNVLAGGENNQDLGAIIAFAAQGAGTTNSPTQSNLKARGIVVVVDITAITGTTPTLTVTLQGVDSASGKAFTLLATTALAATGTTVLTVYPGLVAAANSVADNVLPAHWRISAVIGGTSPSVTATIGATLIK